MKKEEAEAEDEIIRELQKMKDELLEDVMAQGKNVFHDFIHSGALFKLGVYILLNKMNIQEVI